MIVYTLLIHHRHGDDVTVYASEAGAKLAAYQFAETWWHEVGGPMPEDEEAATKLYFESNEGEWCDISATTVVGVDDDEQMIEAMENDPQYRDVVHHERN